MFGLIIVIVLLIIILVLGQKQCNVIFNRFSDKLISTPTMRNSTKSITLNDICANITAQKFIDDGSQEDITIKKTAASGGKLAGKMVSASDDTDDDCMMTHIHKPPIDDEMAYQRDMSMRDSINKMYMNDICPGDQKLYQKMQHMSIKNKKAMDARATFDKYSMLPYLRQELDDAENSVWWEMDNLEWEL